MASIHVTSSESSTSPKRRADGFAAGENDLTVDDPYPSAQQIAEDEEIIAQVTAEVLSVVRLRSHVARATYRLQFHGGFRFRDAAAVVPYLSRLGVSHVYASPVLQARPGSEHGYDVCDHTSLDAELGGQQGWNEFIAALRQHQMELLLDIVPNHMAAHASNPWWNDVLENGVCSPFARYFDIDWHPAQRELDNTLLLPVLGGQYGEVLERGELRVEYHAGALVVRYFDDVFPLDPQTTDAILADDLDSLRAALATDAEALDDFTSILTALAHLPSRTIATNEAVVERQRDKEVLKRRLRELVTKVPAIKEFIDRNIERINGTVGSPASFDRLDALLAAQAYRLCHWRAAGDDVNYRRFFDINQLAAVCMEHPLVFYQTHRLIMQLVADGAVSGLRIDHIDGLFAPERYLQRLQWAYLAELIDRALKKDNGSAPRANGAPPAHDPAEIVPRMRIIDRLCHQLRLPRPGPDDWLAIFGSDVPLEGVTVDLSPSDGDVLEPSHVDRPTIPLFVIVEKILGPHEPLPESWLVQGTTGYDFLKMCDGLCIPADGYRQMQRDYSRFAGQTATFGVIASESKRLILRVAMSGELQMLAHQLNHISEQHRRYRDFTLNMLRYALREVLVSFPVYRIYPGPGHISDDDRGFVLQATALAKRRNPAMDSSIFDFIRDILLLQHPPELSAAAIAEREQLAGRIQQVTSPLMAKGVEDTAFYVYCPLVSTNEVGNTPESPVVAPREFHQWNVERAEHYPAAMLTASTHDTKRSEDVRSRLHVLAEIPRSWRNAVQRWARLNKRRRLEVEGQPAPSRTDEYMIYQNLLGVWPVRQPDAAQVRGLVQRLEQYMNKACHEAKERTSWISPNSNYDQAVTDFVGGLLDDTPRHRFPSDFSRWQQRISTVGLVNSVAELTLRLMCPGFPDIYQGQELWNFRLVDPDNRAPVDYEQRMRLLAEIEQAAQGDRVPFTRRMADDLSDERVKLYLLSQLLDLRRQWPEFFAKANYRPLECTGAQAEHVITFSRVLPEQEFGDTQKALIVVVPRLAARLLGLTTNEDAPPAKPYGKHVWYDALIELSPDLTGTYTEAISGRQQILSSHARVADLLADFPVAVLARESL